MQTLSKTVLSLAVAFALGGFAAPAAMAQASIPAADAAPFMGEWSLPLQGDAPVVLELSIRDEAGQVAANVVAQGNSSPVTSITKADGNLVLAYNLDLGGQVAPISIRLTPEGTNLAAVLDVAQGMFTANGTASRKP